MIITVLTVVYDCNCSDGVHDCDCSDGVHDCVCCDECSSLCMF